MCAFHLACTLQAGSITGRPKHTSIFINPSFIFTHCETEKDDLRCSFQMQNRSSVCDIYCDMKGSTGHVSPGACSVQTDMMIPWGHMTPAHPAHQAHINTCSHIQTHLNTETHSPNTDTSHTDPVWKQTSHHLHTPHLHICTPHT